MKNKIPKWKELTDRLKSEIQENRFGLGEKFYSVNEICEKNNVSTITARRILSELEKERIIKTQQGKGSFVIKNPQPVDIKVLVHSNHTPEKAPPQNYLIIFQILEGISDAARETGAKVSIITHTDFLKNKSKGNNLIVFEDLGIEILNRIDIKKDNNVVIVHSYDEYENCGTVGIDYEKGAYLAVRHLLELGHRRIAFLSGMITVGYSLPRFEGYVKALNSAKINLDLRIVKETSADMPDDMWAMDLLMNSKNPPTAIFASNDGRALHALKYCEENNIPVPEKLSIIGFDNIPEASFATPPLTTMDTQIRGLGKEAVYSILDMINGKNDGLNKLIIPELKIRNSTSELREG